ncbi:phosphomevalonate kinase [Lactobacillus selangorensis]|uniref:phosphomevalonate kinase n=1 Tax=Lactobacillus selangorensis TaxID=81857 RepID=A0A0R2FUA3_9LACO|nr:phosphomevalonate kinase [Lactobacillus selangorensis]KRN28346.1 phosphomevalonate kinase [Lactobacillus selangorensis]KRN31848.1 phosphomevalonate kinase [Lactobacillus selangorensis]
MSNEEETIVAKAPGKLYIAGEYAVVETGYPAVVVGLDQFVTVQIEASTDMGSIQSKQYQENSLYWRREEGQLVFDNRDNPFHYILSAIHFTEQYAQERGLRMRIYHLKVDSDLDSADGKKYGLGSSAAVTVATVKALGKFYKLNLTKPQLYKLAAIAHLAVQGNGSLGDIAASVYGGWLAYSTFDHEWLKAAQQENDLTTLLDMDWPGLQIELLDPPANMQLLIGWTGSPASTSHLVDQVTESKDEEQSESTYQQFLQDSKACIKKMVKGFKDGSLATIQKGIRVDRKLLRKLGQASHVNIETPILTKMCDLAESFGGAAKSSGAGGGDCGIVLIDKSIDTTQLLQAWHDNGIEQLKMNVHQVED